MRGTVYSPSSFRKKSSPWLKCRLKGRCLPAAAPTIASILLSECPMGISFEICSTGEQ